MEEINSLGKYRGLFQNIVLFAINSVATRLISFLLVPLYTTYLSEGQYGVTDMSLTVVTLLVPLATLSISDAVLRFVIEDKGNSKQYISSGLLVLLLSYIIVSLLLPLLDLGIFGGLGNYKGWFWLAYASNALLIYQSNVARALDQVRLIPLASGLTSVATLIGAYFFIVRLGMKVDGYFMCTVFGSMVGSVAYEALGCHRKYLVKPSLKELTNRLKAMMEYAIPLTPNALFWWVNNSISRFFVTGILGIATNGLYAAASKIPNLLNAVFQIFQQAWQISAYQEYKHKDASHFFTTVYIALQFLMFTSAAFLSAISPLLAKVLLQKSFYFAWNFIPMLLVAFFFNTIFTFFGTMYTASMETGTLFVTTLIGAVATVIGCWILIPAMGLLGACVTNVISNFLVLLARVRGAKKVVALDIDWIGFSVCTALLLIQAVLAALDVDNYVWLSLVCAIAVLMVQSYRAKGVLSDLCIVIGNKLLKRATR